MRGLTPSFLNGKFKGGGTQFWLEDEVVQAIDWTSLVEKELPGS